MARMLQRSNQPSANSGSWGGFFSCCFASPKSHSPSLPPPPPPPPALPQPSPLSPPSPKIPSIKVITPPRTLDGSTVEESMTSDHSALNSASDSVVSKDQVVIRNERSSRVEDDSGKQSRPSSQHLVAYEKGNSNLINTEAMYKTWEGEKESQLSKPRDNISSLAPASGPSDVQTPIHSLSPAPMSEFAEEPYTKDYKWQSQTNQNAPASLNLPANATIYTHIKMNLKTSELIIRINRVENAFGEDRSGPPAYQIRLTLLGLKKKKRWHSRILPAPNPVFNETVTFKGIMQDELARMALRLRLYGCKKLRRHFIYAESTVAFTALNLRDGEADIPFALASKVGHESVVDTDSDSGDNLSRLQANRMDSRISMNSRASHLSTRLHQAHSPATSASDLPNLETARRVADDKDAKWPELLCGLAYNTTTKRISVHVVRAVRLKVPASTLRTPKVYVSLTLVTATGEKITSSHTPEVHLSTNTEFDKHFTFDMNSLNPSNVTLFVRVFQKHHVHKRESLGWFAIGSKNSGEEEHSHWNEMLQSQGGEITRWHALNENIT